MTDFFICVSTNLFRIYLIRKFIQIFLGENRQSKLKECLAYGAFYVVNTGLYLLFHLAWVNIISNLAGIGLMVFMYSRSVKTNLFVTCSIYLIHMGCDAITILLFVAYQDGRGFNQFYAVITVFLILICELLAEKIISDRRNADNVRNLPLIAVPFCSIAMILYIFYTKNRTDMELVVLSIGLLIINFLVLYLYNMLLKTFMQKYENDFLRQRLEIYSNQIEVILQSEDAVKNLRHDMKHHMNELKLLAMKNDSLAVQEYIDNMEAYIQNPNEIVSSGNTEIDSVLNYMLKMGKRELLSVNTKIQLPEAVSHAFDINIILGNLLENAIEAARQTEEKLLNVNIQLKQGVLRIEIENSFHNPLLLEENKEKDIIRLSTTKREKKGHGIGLNSVRKIVEKYDGIIDVHTKDNRFCVRLILYMPEIN